MAVAAGELQHDGGDVLGQALGEADAVGVQHLGDALHGRGLPGGLAGVVPGDDHVHVGPAGERGGDGVERGALQAGVVVFGHDENGSECGHGVPVSLR